MFMDCKYSHAPYALHITICDPRRTCVIEGARGSVVARKELSELQTVTLASRLLYVIHKDDWQFGAGSLFSRVPVLPDRATLSCGHFNLEVGQPAT